nr:immunoglobulin heavy chain junction region [Mus musculus]MBK4195982.1 immunoglobulin heavy chain junction region [Mus musculus]
CARGFRYYAMDYW